MTIVLTNTTRRVRVVLLPHDIFCARAGRCACTKRRDGVRLPAALTLPARESVDRLDEALLALPEVLAAVRAGDLRVTTEPAPEPAPAPSAVPAGAPPEDEPNEPRRPERRPDQSRRGAR